PDHHADRRRIQSIAWSIHLRTIRDDEYHVEVHRNVDVVSRRRNAVDHGEFSVRLDRHVHEEVQIRDDIALAHPVFGQFQNEVLTAGMLVSGGLSKTYRVTFARAAS